MRRVRMTRGLQPGPRVCWAHGHVHARAANLGCGGVTRERVVVRRVRSHSHAARSVHVFVGIGCVEAVEEARAGDATGQRQSKRK